MPAAARGDGKIRVMRLTRAGRLTIAAIAALSTGAAWAGSGIAAPRAQTPQQPGQFRTGVDVVHLPVVVTGRSGDLVRGLAATDFSVLEDGAPQTVTYFAEGAPGAALPLHLALVLDGSVSMEKDLRSAAGAAIQFVEALDEAVDVTFVDFDTSVSLGRFERPSYPLLFERIRARKPRGATALYDALAVYLETALDRDGQHVLLLYTDGGDSASTIHFGKLQELLRLGDVLIYAIGYLEHQRGNERALQQMRITQIARETGGEAFFPASVRDLNEHYARILDELGSRYTLGYVSTNPARDRKFRKVEVKLTRSELRGAKVRTRTGYLAPAAARRP
jgi:Ca-activated chloride channel family protein